MSETQGVPSGLVIIARDATDHIITRLTCTHSRNVVSAMKSARSVLLLKEGAIRVEIHANEGPTSSYLGKPLAVISTDDLKGMPNGTPLAKKPHCDQPRQPGSNPDQTLQ
jgi:hypothetical protein